jgi:DNA-binding NarL/FixJ family response regulator
MEVPRLTAREIAVLRIVAEGARDREVALRLGLRPRTVSSYLTQFYRKLQVSTRTAAVHAATEYDLL